MASNCEKWGYRVLNTGDDAKMGWCNERFCYAGRVALGGFMGTGKSTIGSLLAKELGVSFIDMDQRLTETHGPIPRQFERDGEPVFRARERQLLAQLSEEDPCVVATGGGLWVDERNRDALGRHFTSVVLHARWDTLVSRVDGGKERPLWDEDVYARFSFRQPYYEWGDLHVQTDGKSPNEVTEEIVQWLKESS